MNSLVCLSALRTHRSVTPTMIDSPPDDSDPIAQYSTDESCARRLDDADPLRSYRKQFSIPAGRDGRPVVYLAGNSLGLQPRRVRELVTAELDAWARHGVEGHFHGDAAWFSYHELLRETGARLVGAEHGEVVMMNGLTVNLHLMMVTFYRPTESRYKIVMEDAAFPSDTYAVKSQLRHHGRHIR